MLSCFHLINRVLFVLMLFHTFVLLSLYQFKQLRTDGFRLVDLFTWVAGMIHNNTGTDLDNWAEEVTCVKVGGD